MCQTLKMWIIWNSHRTCQSGLVMWLLFPMFSFWLLVLTHISVCLESTNMLYSNHTKQRILFSGSARACGHPFAPAWFSGHSESSSSFSARTKALSDKISQIVLHLAKHPIYVTVSFRRNATSVSTSLSVSTFPSYWCGRPYVVRSTTVALFVLYTYVT